MSYVYVIGQKGGLLKIGSSVAPDRRLAGLQSGSPLRLEILYLAQCDDAHDIEVRTHRILKASRAHGEWFRVSVKRAIQAIQEAMEQPAMEAAEAAKREAEEAQERAQHQARLARVQEEERATAERFKALLAAAKAEYDRDPEAFEAMLDKLKAQAEAKRRVRA